MMCNWQPGTGHAAAWHGGTEPEGVTLACAVPSGRELAEPAADDEPVDDAVHAGEQPGGVAGHRIRQTNQLLPRKMLSCGVNTGGRSGGGMAMRGGGGGGEYVGEKAGPAP
jgi:hypothetical protein